MNAICQNNISRTQHSIIARSLTKDLLADCITSKIDIRSLTLGNEQRTSLGIQHDNIGTLRHCIQCDGILLYDGAQRGVAMRDEKLHQMTTHPLLGSKHNVRGTHTIKDHRAPIILHSV